MNSKFNELKKFSDNKYLTSSMCRSVTINSIKELLKSETGRVYTGTCYVKPIKLKHGIVAEHFRDVWTDEVAEVLDRFEIQYEKGYDHDKAGANGAYVQVTDAEFLTDSIFVEEN